jgi:hypothetical protein
MGFMVGRVALGQVYRLVAYFDLLRIHTSTGRWAVHGLQDAVPKYLV